MNKDDNYITFEDNDVTLYNKLDTVLKGWTDNYNHLTVGNSTYAWNNTYSSYMNDFTGVIVQHYEKGKLIKEDCFDYNEKTKEEMHKIEDDIKKKQKEYADAAVYRLTNVYADDKGLIRIAPDGNTVYCTEEVLNELLHGVKRTVYLNSEIAEFCSAMSPEIFDGWNVVLIDDANDVDMTDLPKDLDFKDETPDEVVQNIRDKTSELRRAQKRAIEDAEKDDSLVNLSVYKNYY